MDIGEFFPHATLSDAGSYNHRYGARFRTKVPRGQTRLCPQQTEGIRAEKRMNGFQTEDMVRVVIEKGEISERACGPYTGPGATIVEEI